MVYIRKVDIRGFKSLGKLTSLQFDSGFNVISGPNGSGKSNILDAIRFCLGENSPKTLRVSRLASLFSDSSTETSKSIRVTIQYDNGNRIIPVDSDTTTVTREMNQKGESVYYLNGKRIQKNSLSEILNLALISSEGLNIIPQGMIMRISELLPDEKRRLIESVIGISHFDEKKASAEKQLREADVKLQIALARVNEIKNNIDSLEGERNDQLRLKHLEEEIRWFKSVILTRQSSLTKTQIIEQKRQREACLKKQKKRL